MRLAVKESFNNLCHSLLYDVSCCFSPSCSAFRRSVFSLPFRGKFSSVSALQALCRAWRMPTRREPCTHSCRPTGNGSPWSLFPPAVRWQALHSRGAEWPCLRALFPPRAAWHPRFSGAAVPRGL